MDKKLEGELLLLNNLKQRLIFPRKCSKRRQTKRVPYNLNVNSGKGINKMLIYDDSDEKSAPQPQNDPDYTSTHYSEEPLSEVGENTFQNGKPEHDSFDHGISEHDIIHSVTPIRGSYVLSLVAYLNGRERNN